MSMLSSGCGRCFTHLRKCQGHDALIGIVPFEPFQSWGMSKDVVQGAERFFWNLSSGIFHPKSAIY